MLSEQFTCLHELAPTARNMLLYTNMLTRFSVRTSHLL